jgi:hypothetical protein
LVQYLIAGKIGQHSAHLYNVGCFRNSGHAVECDGLTCGVDNLVGIRNERFFERNTHKRKKNISRDFTRDQAVQQAYELLKQKALQIGASSEDLEMEILEDQLFNMVRGFQTTGRNIRIKAQVKPGLIQRYKDVVEKLSLQSDS